MASPLRSKTARARAQADRKGNVWEPIPGTGVSLGYSKRSGRWLARQFIDGKEKRIRLGKRADDKMPADGTRILNYAQAAEAAIEAASNIVSADLASLTVSQAFDRYRRSRDAEGRDTRDSIQRFRKWIAPTFGSSKVIELGRAELVEWRDMVARSVKPATVNRTLTIFKAMLRYALEELEVPYKGAPIYRALKPLKVEKKARERFLTPVELGQLANECEPDLQRLVLAAAYTGARFGDLARLKVSDWDSELRKACVMNSKTNQPRFVPVTRAGAAFFDSLTAGRDPNEIALQRHTGQHWGKNTYARGLKQAAEAAGLDAVNFHAIRHSYASAMKRAGVDDTIIAKALGHTSTKMVQEHYAHLAESHVDEQIRNHAPEIDIDIEKSSVTRL